MTLFQVSYFLLWALAAILVPIAILLVYLIAHLEEQFKREGSGVGSALIGQRMPRILAVDASTRATREISDFEGRVRIVLAVSPSCGTCVRLINEVCSARDGRLHDANLIVLCVGELERCAAAVTKVSSVPTYLLDTKDDSTMDLWLVGFPAALVVDEFGVISHVRHPLSVQGVLAALRMKDKSSGYSLPRQEAAAP